MCGINNYKLDTAIHNTGCDTIHHTLPQQKQLAKDINNVKVFKQKMINDKKVKTQFDKLNLQSKWVWCYRKGCRQKSKKSFDKRIIYYR